MAQVVLLVDDVEVKKYHTTGERTLIGRIPSADILIDDNTVSAKHAVIEAVQMTGEESGRLFFIQDLCSTNGTLVCGERVRRKRLRDGDLIKIGWNTFRFLERDELKRDNSPQERAVDSHTSD